AGFVLGGLPTTGAAYLALASASVAPVFAGVGALASQLAPSRAGALGLASLVLALTLLARVLADTVAGAGWLRCLSPLGWAELLRPFAGPRPLVLLLPVLSTVLLLAVAARLAAGRDIGTGMLASRDRAEPRLRLLGSPIGLALRAQRSTLLSWLGAVAGFMFILGVVSHAISAADVPRNVQDEIAKLGAGSIVTPLGYLGLVFVFVMVAVCGFGCLQVGSARREEVGQQLEQVLAQPIGRTRWLVGRLVLAALDIALLALAAGLLAWLGARAAGVRLGLLKLLEAGANMIPIALLFLGVAALAYAIVPRASSGISYGLLAVAFCWQLVGSLLGPPRWLLELTPFAHVGLVPAQPFQATAALSLAGAGLAACTIAVAAFRRRDLLTG
ncbi:MAG: polyketide antibiotic transporter, partial [Jatrophihabitantaceae bacterium]